MPSDNLSAPERYINIGAQLLKLAGGEGGGAGDQAVARGQAVDESAVLCGVVRRSRVVDAHRVDARTVRCPQGARSRSNRAVSREGGLAAGQMMKRVLTLTIGTRVIILVHATSVIEDRAPL